MPKPRVSDDDSDELVEPLLPPAAAPAGPGEEDSLGSAVWDFTRRIGSGSSGQHFRPTRHASLDAGYLQQRVFAAQTVLDRPGGQVVPAAGSAAGVLSSGPAGARAGQRQHGDSTSPNEGIEIAWVGFLMPLQLLPACCRVTWVQEGEGTTPWQMQERPTCTWCGSAQCACRHHPYGRTAHHSDGSTSHQLPWLLPDAVQVWPPCLASDAGPVEFAVNVAPREWLTGEPLLAAVLAVLC